MSHVTTTACDNRLLPPRLNVQQRTECQQCHLTRLTSLCVATGLYTHSDKVTTSSTAAVVTASGDTVTVSITMERMMLIVMVTAAWWLQSAHHIAAYPTGSPASACRSMEPSHGQAYPAEQARNRLEVQSTTYYPGQPLSRKYTVHRWRYSLTNLM